MLVIEGSLGFSPPRAREKVCQMMGSAEGQSRYYEAALCALRFVEARHQGQARARGGRYLDCFLDGECQTLGLTHADLEAWRPSRATKSSTKAVRAQATSDDAYSRWRSERGRRERSSVRRRTADANAAWSSMGSRGSRAFTWRCAAASRFRP
jgi:hypothetical protein